jgi:sugar O-acyltransferase (sialic acid O-acetyltransferase NeuD family)
MLELLNGKEIPCHGLAIICAGGYGREVYDTAIRSNRLTRSPRNIIFVDDFADQINIDKKITYAKVISAEEFINSNIKNIFNAVVAIGEPSLRRKLYQKFLNEKINFTTVIDPTSCISDSAKILNGVIVGPLASIQAEVYLAENVSINSAVIIGHDARVMANSVISSQVNLGGGVTVGDSTYIGMGALIKEGIKIGSNSIIGMGSVVYNDIPDGVIALGNPARVMRNNENQKVFK